MKRWIKRIGQTLVAAFVVVSVGVGLTQLQATTTTLSHCVGNAFHCASEQECDDACEMMKAEGGDCTASGCCFCFF